MPRSGDMFSFLPVVTTIIPLEVFWKCKVSRKSLQMSDQGRTMQVKLMLDAVRFHVLD